MENATLIALSAQNGLRRRLEVVANNVANVNTVGFKRERLMMTPFVPPMGSDGAVRGGRPVFVRDLATIADQAAGHLQATGNLLDLGLRGDGYFVVDAPGGNRYSRDGHFRTDEQGQLVTGDGNPVLGEGGQPIVLPQSYRDIGVTRDGTVSADGAVVGKLQIVRFANPASLRAEGGSLWRSEAPPIPVERAEVVQGMLESSNVQSVIEIEHLIRVHRAYEQAKKLVDSEDERMKKMLQVYGS
jgi:flagellar basal-body rod protein FlgF